MLFSPRRAVLLAALLGACSDAAAPTCSEDAQCRRTEICQAQTCISKADLECVDGRVPAISAAPALLSFGRVEALPLQQTVRVSNAGNCVLQISTVTLAEGAGSRFTCVSCLGEELPKSLYPGRNWDLVVEVQPGDAGQIEDQLVIQSSDPERRYLEIPLDAESGGRPEITVTPTQLDFGFAAANQTVTRILSVINTGLGGAPLEVTDVDILGDDRAVFAVDPVITSPISIAPSATDPTARLDLSVTLTPTEERVHTAELLIKRNGGDPITVPMSSLAEPPKIQVSKTMLDFGSVPLGQSVSEIITVQNTGRAPLRAAARIDSVSADLSLIRTFSAEIEPGRFTEIAVFFTPTVQGPISGRLIIESNDPDQTEIQIPLSGIGEPLPPGNEVVAIELRFDNDSSSILDADLRDADLILENPTGAICSEAMPSPTWGVYGTPHWTGTPPRKNPERIVLAGVAQDGSFAVTLVYNEDCASLPTALVASLLGIGVDELTDYLSEGEVDLDPTMLAMIVEQTCVDRKGAGAHLRVTINGTTAFDMPVSLSAKGDFVTPIQLVRSGGVFSVMP